MYTALYRKWRPLSFNDVVSQPSITTTLKNQIANQKTAHAYLFTGSRGTGKTTCARIFAKAINCQNSQNGNPCLECEICKNADTGSMTDIIEIDAASNTGVEDIRELRQSTNITPERCKYKVYIIDEVHMLSNNAFNALLKIMEEPPAHVKFILATTEIHKVPATIISRCQRFDFRRILTSDIVDRIIYISKKEGISLTTDAAELIARIADGGMRDALSLLDQCIAYSTDVDINTVSFAAGIADREYLFEIIQAILEKNSAKCIDKLNKLYTMSKDLQRFCEELLDQFRNLMLIKSVPDNHELLSCLNSERIRLEEIAEKFSLSDILDKMDILQSTSDKLYKAVSKRVEAEMCMIRLCYGNKSVTSAQAVQTNDSEISALNAKLLSLERMLASGKIKVSNNTANEKAAAKNIENPLVPNAPAPVEPGEPLRIDLKKVTSDKLVEIKQWHDVMEQFTTVSPSVSGALGNSRAFSYEEDGQALLIIYYNNSFFGSLFKNRDKAALLYQTVTNVLGKNFYIRTKCVKDLGDDSESPINKLLNKAKSADVEVSIN